MKWIVADLKNNNSYRAALRGCAAVVHAAALTRNGDENELKRVNVDATLEMVRAAHEEGIKKIIVFSTAAVTHEWLSPYARSKMEMEKQLRLLHFPVIILRPTLVYFLGSRHIANFKRLCRLPFPFIPLPHGGSAQVNPIHRDDVVQAVMAILDKPFPAQTKTYDLASTQHCSLRDAVQLVQERMGLHKYFLGYDSGLFSSIYDLFHKLGIKLPSFIASFGAIGSGYRVDSSVFMRDYAMAFKNPFIEIPTCLNAKKRLKE